MDNNQGSQLFQDLDDSFRWEQDPTPQSPPSPWEQLDSSHHLPIPSYEYEDKERPQYLYSENDNGSLFCVGLAGPNDFHPNGMIHGARPSQTQRPGLATIEVATTQPHPSPILATQETTNSSMNISPPGQLSTQRTMWPPMTGSPQV
jgi:hypothetical protein